LRAYGETNLRQRLISEPGVKGEKSFDLAGSSLHFERADNGKG
jgi:hypothetical protein